jgi:RNA polymerase sigma factor (sigma-70 family)
MPAQILKLITAAPVDGEPCDAELLGRFLRTRDEDAFTDLVRRHGRLVHRVCSRLVGPDLVEDAFQAVFIVLACRANRVRKPAAVGSWLVGVAGRVARQLREREFQYVPAALSEVAERSRGPQGHLLGKELTQMLDEELTRLSRNLRDVVVLCLMQGKTQKQAAAELGSSVRTLRRRLNRAKAILRLRLESRGVLPAVAAGVLNSGMASASAVPSKLISATIEAVAKLNAGAATLATPASIAQGVIANMVTPKLWMSIASAVILGIGLVWAASAQSNSRQDDPPGDKRAGPHETSRAQIADPTPGKGLPPASHQTTNFVVYAPTPMLSRVVAGESEYQREHIAKLWLGKALPNWENPSKVVVTFGWAAGAGSTTFTFADSKKNNRNPTEIEIRLDGLTLESLEVVLPREVAETVFATHFGKPLPRWAGGGIARLHEPETQQSAHDTLIRQILNDGRGLRLKALFRMTEYPQDMTFLNAQSHSVFLFLLDTGHARGALLGFIADGMKKNTAEGWDTAAATLGYKSVDALESAWLEWLKKPESRIKEDRQPPPKTPEDKTDRIPPIKLPGGSERPTGP